MKALLRSRGGAALMWSAVAFGLIQFFCGLVFDYVVPGLRNPLMHMHLRTMDLRPNPPEILLVGSSRTGCALHDLTLTALFRQQTDDVAQVYNAAIPGSDPIVWEPLVRAVLARPMRPRLIVVELLPETICDRSHCVQFHIQRQLTWTNWIGHLRAMLATSNIGRFVTSRLFPLLTHRERIHQRIGEFVEPGESAGPQTEVYSQIDWRQMIVGDPVGDPTRRLYQGVHQVERELVDYGPRGPAIPALERLLYRCKRAGVPVVLVGIPVASPHREQYTPEVETRFQRYVASLKDRFGTDWLDFRDALPDADFADHNHAAVSGRNRFGPMFVREVLMPRWNQHR